MKNVFLLNGASLVAGNTVLFKVYGGEHHRGSQEIGVVEKVSGETVEVNIAGTDIVLIFRDGKCETDIATCELVKICSYQDLLDFICKEYYSIFADELRHTIEIREFLESYTKGGEDIETEN